MAIFANIGGRNVISLLSHCGHAVMTREARGNDAAVLKERGQPRCYAMTVVALLTGWQVCYGFAICFAAIMATVAGTQSLEMINPRNSDP